MLESEVENLDARAEIYSYGRAVFLGLRDEGLTARIILVRDLAARLSPIVEHCFSQFGSSLRVSVKFSIVPRTFTTKEGRKPSMIIFQTREEAGEPRRDGELFVGNRFRVVITDDPNPNHMLSSVWRRFASFCRAGRHHDVSYGSCRLAVVAIFQMYTYSKPVEASLFRSMWPI